MVVALISDIHANLEALDAVLEDIANEKVDRVWCLGDMIGYGCDPGACLKKAQDSCDITLMGNHEYAALGLISSDYLNEYAQRSMDWTISAMNDREIAAIADLPLSSVQRDGLLVHASPHGPDQWHYVLSSHDAQQAFDDCDQWLCFHGHTHLPMIFSLAPDGKVRGQAGHDIDVDPENRYLINVGSVGQPRDNDPRACYVLFDAERGSVRYRRVAYDIKKTQTKMAEAHLPSMLIERLEVGR
jgi:diadenosine tetraphosphatase ApaH/serine/threonine PP2A family protein phosphatase